MQAAVLPVSASKASVGAAHGTPSLDPAKSDDTETGADAFTQALAGSMGVTPGPAPAPPATTSDAATVQTVAAQAVPAKPTPLVAISPAPSQGLGTANLATPADPAQTLQPAPSPEVAAAPQAAPAPPPTGAAGDALAALTPTPPAPTAAPPAPVATPAPHIQTDLPLAFSALSFSVTLAGDSIPSAQGQAETPPVRAAAQAPQLQPAAGDNSPGATPIAALTLTADESAAALPASANPVKPLATASPKATPKSDAATSPTSAEAEPSVDRPASATAVPATAPVFAEAADPNAKSAPDTADQSPQQTPSNPNAADSASLSGLAATPMAPQAAIQTPVNLAAANGAAIVSQIATQVAKSVDGKSTRFDISLDPAGLGHVNVKVEIGAQGQITAQLSFDNAHTAAEAKSQAGQLQQALEQAGFNVAQGGLSFDVGGQGSGFAGQDASAQQPLALSIADVSTDTQTAAVAAASSRPASGVDITI